MRLLVKIKNKIFTEKVINKRAELKKIDEV